MRLTDLRRTTGFRLATLFLALFGVVAILLFGYLYFQITGFEEERIDDWLLREQAEVRRQDPARLTVWFDNQSLYDPRHQRPFALYDAHGAHLAGGYRGPLPSGLVFDKPFSTRLESLDKRPPGRCIATRLPDSRISLQCQNGRELDHFDEELLHALISTGLVTLAIGLIGASLIGVSAMRRLDALTRSIEEIVAGNLGRRLPVQSRHDDVDRLVLVVNGMLDEIERLMHEVKGVCDAIAHDLRTPMTRMLAALERAQRRAATQDEYRAAIEEAIVETGGMLRTFNALLRISEIESGVRRSGFVRVDMAAVADDVFEFYEPTAEEKQIRFEIRRLPGQSFPLQGDPNLLFEALANLVDNALKFAAPGGHVLMEMREDASTASIVVSDDGPGIPPGEREAVLRRFYRGEYSRHAPGSGLGLSLVSAVAGMHGLRVGFHDVARGLEIALSWPNDGRLLRSWSADHARERS